MNSLREELCRSISPVREYSLENNALFLVSIAFSVIVGMPFSVLDFSASFFLIRFVKKSDSHICGRHGDLFEKGNIQVKQGSDDAQNFNRKKNDHPGVQIYSFQDLSLRDVFWHGFIKLKLFPLDPAEQQDEP